MWWNKYIHLPFVEKGRDEAGVDCWGLVRLIYEKELNIKLPDYLGVYNSTRDDGEILARTIRSERDSSWLNPDEPREFDVIILKILGLPMHVGLVTKKNYMLHCTQGINTVHERFDSLRWKNKVIGFSRHERVSSLRFPAAI